jgi:hypothetical protein
MDIEDAFTTEAIEAAGTNVGGTEEAGVREVIATVLQQQSVPPNTEQITDLAVLAFVAGRTYENDHAAVTLRMTPRIMSAFLQYCIDKGFANE